MSQRVFSTLKKMECCDEVPADPCMLNTLEKSISQYGVTKLL